jgi:FtsZ-interacting cell division protein ZipA
VGGVVGGIALVGLVCGGVLFWMKRKEKVEKGGESPKRRLVG